MEEILASIRRIIEDSDSGRKPADEETASEPFMEPAEAEGPAEVVDAFRTELHAEPAEAKPVSLVDVQARPADSEEGEPVSRPAVTLAEVGARLAAEQAAAPKEAASAEAITADWQREIAAAGSPARHADRPALAETVSADAPADVDTSAEDASRGAAPAAGSPHMPGEGDVLAKPGLVSEQTSRQVAAAFGELSEAFASRSRKSFDEMAEEMLRPMLQDWLDNNLPTLVERLVREEIERVARGG